MNQKKIKEKVTIVEAGGGKEAAPQEASVGVQETCSQKQTTNKEGQGFVESPL